MHRFDLETDPYELNDLSADPAQAQVIDKMNRLMQGWQAQLGDPMRLKVSKPHAKEVVYDNKNRKVDRWQPLWIREKYFSE